jgi:hypothetical protein
MPAKPKPASLKNARRVLHVMFDAEMGDTFMADWNTSRASGA